MPDLVAIDLVEPEHSQAIGLVISDRDPPSPMAEALLGSLMEADLEADLVRAMPQADRQTYHVFQAFHWIWRQYRPSLVARHGADQEYCHALLNRKHQKETSG